MENDSWAILERQKLRCYNGIMTNQRFSFTSLNNDELLREVTALARHERAATARLIASLAELDARRLYLGEGFRSMFSYCTQGLRLSEHAAYGRIEAARVARKWPMVLDLLDDGSITITALGLLSSHLTDENHRAVLDAARHRSKREVEEQVAELRPRLPVPASVLKLPGPVLAPQLYQLQLTIGQETHDKLRRVQDLLRHSVPDGDSAIIIDRALTLLLAQLERTKHAAVRRPRPTRPSKPTGRRVSASVKREVWQRDGGQCAFVGACGRCRERGCLEFHHVVPFADGGESTSANLQLRCRAHNAYEADQYFGAMFVREGHEGYQLGPDRVTGERPFQVDESALG